MVLKRIERKRIDEQKLTVIDAIQHLKRELVVISCDDYPKIINTDDNSLPSQDSYDPSVGGNQIENQGDNVLALEREVQFE